MDMKAVDSAHAVEIAERVWWVGHYLKDDLFQCHVYLIENNDQSVLIDPGSKLTFPNTLRKIEEVTAFSNIRYFICHHQDPDITGAMELIDQMISRDDALLVTHWRAAALLKHYGLQRLPFWQVEDHDWQLQLDDRTLRFIFTPYLHFPGAFCTFDEQSRILFSSDIFGGFTKEWSLYARDESYFESIRPFHEHYMPGRDILQHGLSRMQKYPIRMIAPQHGSIIPESLVDFMFDRLKGLECGLYLMVEQDTDIRKLVEMNKMLRDAMEAMVLYRDFRDISHHLLKASKKLLPVKSLSFIVRNSTEYLLLGPGNNYHGAIIDIPPGFEEIFSSNFLTWKEKQVNYYRKVIRDSPEGDGQEPQLLVPLFSTNGDTCRAMAVLHLEGDVIISEEMNSLLGRLTEPLLTAVEREMLFRSIEEDRNATYERSIRDPLTGLFTRIYMKDAVTRMLELHDREANAPVSVVMLDLDHFKQINDIHGHVVGDEVLKKVGSVLLSECRRSDIPVRFGGEEFVSFIVSALPDCGASFANRVRKRVAELEFSGAGGGFSITVSGGVSVHRSGESLESVIHRADTALYTAKETGRNCVCIASE